VNYTENNISFTLDEILEKGYDYLIEVLHQSPGKCKLCFPYEEYHHYSDIAIGSLQKAFIGEILYPNVTNIDYNYEHDQFIIDYQNKEFSKIIYWLSGICSYDEDDLPEDYDSITESLPFKHYIHEEFSQFEADIYSRKIYSYFSDFVDDYFANIIEDENTWNDDNKTLCDHPEWAYHTWRSAWSYWLGFDLYVSPKFWLIHKGNDISKAIETASFHKGKIYKFSNIKTFFSDHQNIYLFTEYDIICLNNCIHFNAVRCAENIFPVYDKAQDNAQYDWYSRGKFSVSSDSYILKWDGASFQYIIFRDTFNILDSASLKKLTAETQNIINMLFSVSKDSFKYRCDWQWLNDELFEQLCYHLTIRDGRFSESDTRKMGHSRSRDGGRDILTKNIRRAGDNRQSTWIIQCKFSLKGRSLGRNQIMLSEIIDEHNPHGIIIATNMLVDSGTYDKYDKIGKNRKVKIEIWDGLKLEREINKNPDLYVSVQPATS